MNNHRKLRKRCYTETENCFPAHIYFIALWTAVTGLLCSCKWRGEYRGSWRRGWDSTF